MRNKENLPGGESITWASIPDIDLRANGELTGRLIQMEYEGLDSGELAWILGRRFVNQFGDHAGEPNLEDAADGPMGMYRAFNASAHGLGMGYGPDRMQRLAYTSWVCGFFRAKFGTKAIDLGSVTLTSQKALYLSSVLKDYETFVAGANALVSVDVPYMLQSTVGGLGAGNLKYGGGVNAAATGLSSGLFVMEKGPFLRGKIINSDAVDVVSAGCFEPNSGAAISHTQPRNLGDELAFEALYAEMRAEGMFDWTPDGMVLSKLESPSGEPMSSAELDARSGQLFNIAVQGPAVAKTWSGESRMACLPMDKVFVVVVADVHTELSDSVEDLSLQVEAINAFDVWVKGNPPMDPKTYQSVKDAMETAKNGKKESGVLTSAEKGDYAKAVEARFDLYAQAAAKPGDAALAQDVVDNLAVLNAAFESFNKQDWEDEAVKLQRGKSVAKSEMCNFRLMRVTSSFLSQYSACTTNADGSLNKEARCGLRLGQLKRNKKEVCAEYIIGGWCIGTVLDSAASRSTVGHQVRTAPAAMAINVSVNIEWWSGDKLYKHYMDVDESVLQRGQLPTEEGLVNRLAGTHVKPADRAEAKPWYTKKELDG